MTDHATSQWTAAHVAAINPGALPHGPAFEAADAVPLFPGLDLWDMWPVQQLNGSTADIAGGTLWMALSAPDMGDPGLRHFHARIRLIHQTASGWRDLGPAMPDGWAPGNREWAGSALIEGDRITLYFSAAGPDAGEGGYQQRLFEAQARLLVEEGGPRLIEWSRPVESVVSDGAHYVIADQQHGEPGRIKAFRDPAHFCDPADGARYLLFVGSLGRSASDYNGCVGLARAGSEAAGDWQLLPPLIAADGLNNELERPHIVVHHGRYYLFWSTQAGVFAPDGPAGPTGLYGMVADSLFGPYRPLNGSGLVIANPPAEPTQAYSWLVMADLRVTSFVDLWGTGGAMPADATGIRRHFGGTPAPFQKLLLDGDRALLTVAGEQVGWAA